MSRGARALLLVVLAVALAGASDALAAEAPAERLHEAALKAHRAGQLRQAIELWRDALKLDPNWKYAYNLANTLYESDEGLDAWKTLARADELQPPEKYAGLVAELRSKVRALLFKAHAWLVLDVRIAGAVVKRNGARWEPPWDAWLEDEESTIEVTAAGYVTETRKVKHERGKRTDLFIELEPERHDPPPPVEVAPRIDDPPLTITPQEPPKVDANGFATPGWITFASGVVLAGIGTGFYFWADATANDIAELHGSPDALEALGYDAYKVRYHDLDGAFEDRLLASHILLGLGGAAVITGITLILLDESPAEGDAAVHVVPVSGGVLVVGGASF